MALFENETLSKREKRKLTNVYLAKPTKGFALIKQIFSRPPKIENVNRQQLCRLIDERLIPLLAETRIEGELELLSSLHRIYDDLCKPESSKLINNKEIVGVGGRFSAGKSCFINSLVKGERKFLPEGMSTTTSIPAYIVNGKRRVNIAISSLGNDITLNNDAVEALAHQFYEQYGIDFSGCIKNMVLQTPYWKYKNIAIMDTPGYNKPDDEMTQNLSDLVKAREQLKNVKNTIWLMDAENGTSQNEDISFLEEVTPNSNVLFIVNKADKKTSLEVETIVSGIKEIIGSTGINCYGVAAYDSIRGVEILSDGIIGGFLSQINKEKRCDSIQNICNSIELQLRERILFQKEKSRNILSVISKSTQPLHSESLINALRRSNADLDDLTAQWVSIRSITDEYSAITSRI
ncbi:MAG: dynamin family protein [Ruminococcus sp.]|nr:dynamin family protein [Ruminococcus sp.]